MAEDEKNAAVESMTSSQDAIEKRPETDFHFFSDSEVTKYVIYISCSHINTYMQMYLSIYYGLKETRTPDRVRLFSRTRNSKCVKLRKRVARGRTTRVISRVGDGANCPAHLRSQRICHIGTR